MIDVFMYVYNPLWVEVWVFPRDFDVEEKIHFNKKSLLERRLGCPPPPSKGF